MILDRWFVRRDDYLAEIAADATEIGRLNEVINGMYGQNDGLVDDLEDAGTKLLFAEEKVRELQGLIAEKLASEHVKTITAEDHAKLLASRCSNCVLPGAYVAGLTPFAIDEKPQMALGDDGLLHDVTKQVIHPYEGSVITVNATGTLPITVTPDHLLCVFPILETRRGSEGWQWRKRHAPEGEQPIWRRADEIQIGDRLVFPVPVLTGEVVPPRWNNVEAAWLLGLLIGDGWTTRRGEKRYHFGVALGLKKDANRAVAALRQIGVKPSVRNYPTYTRVMVSSREVAEEIAGLIGLYSNEKHFPSFVWSSTEILRAALNGLMAADGTHMDRGRRGVVDRLFTTSQVLAWQAWQAALVLGHRPFIRPVRRGSGYANAKPAWTVEWSNATMCTTVVYDGCYIMPVRAVSVKAYTGPVVDLSVEEGHTFVANGVLTHNCGGAHSIACPRVKRIRFRGDGQSPLEIEFWPDSEWPKNEVVWPEELTVEG